MATKKTRTPARKGSPTAEDRAPLAGVPERIVVFGMQGQRYGLPIETVQEIQQIVEISGLPEASPAVIGVVNLRGSVVPVVDMRLLVGLPAVDYGLQTPMIFALTSKGVVALVVDEVEDVLEVPAGSAQAPSRMYALSEMLSCVVRLESGIVFVFDIDRLVPDVDMERVGGDT
jgi:purine-binding chemotaxis protein CheW